MAFIPIANTCRVQMLYEHQGQKVENVYHCIQATPWDVSALSNLGGVFEGWDAGVLANTRVTNAVYMGCIVTSLETEFAPGIEDSAGTGTGGAIGTGDLPMNVTIAVRWLTGIRGRSFRGRTYHIGLPATWITGSRLQDSFADDIKNAYNLLIGAVAAEDANLAVASYRHLNNPRVPGIATVITDVALDLTLDSQRRRLPGRGN